MCDLMTGMIAASTLVGAAGQMGSANAQANASNYNAQVADMNAKIESKRAQDSLERGKIDEQNKRREVAQIKGQQLAGMSANGVDVGYGSALDTLVDTATFGELDALTVRANSAREAYGHDVAAVNKKADSQMFKMEASSAKTNGYLSSLGTLIGGAGDAWGSYKKKTMGAYG
jgi:hypothetical protein